MRFNKDFSLKTLGFSIDAVQFRVLIESYCESKEGEGIIVPQSVLDEKGRKGMVGRVLSVGSGCFKPAERFPDKIEPGDYVIYSAFNRHPIRFKNNPKFYFFINDDDILAVTDDPEEIIL